MSAAPAADVTTYSIIRQVPMFAELSDAEAEELWRHCKRITLSPGELLIREGDPGNALYIILSGGLEVTIKLPTAFGANMAAF